MMHLLSLADWTRDQIEDSVRLSTLLKAGSRGYGTALRGRTLLMMFEKPSLRTRLSFESAMLQTGGHAIHYDLAGSPLGRGKETVADTARTASRFVDAVMARLYRQADLEALARDATVPVINGLTDLEHPCQVLGDLLTLRERHGHLAGLKVAFLGDGNNNVTHSLLDGCSRTGVNVSVACPEAREYLPRGPVLERARRAVSASGARVEVLHDPMEAAEGADAVYADTWLSYHMAADQREERWRLLQPFRVTEAVMEAARRDAVFMHCLPAERGAEVEAAVIDGPRSIVFDQAENRLHAQKAVLLRLLNPQYHPPRMPL